MRHIWREPVYGGGRYRRPDVVSPAQFDVMRMLFNSGFTDFTAKGGAGATVKAGAALSLSGATAELKGSATGTVDGGGALTVKGGIVKIN